MRVLTLLAAVPALILAEVSFRGAEFVEVGPSVAVAEAGREIRVGDTLQAIRDVSLDEAVVAEGSKVNVSGKHAKNGNVLVDVSLADGHVVRGVPLVEVQKNFRRIE